MTDFNSATPPVDVTNPKAATQSAEYPRHVHRFHAAPTDDAPLSETGLVVAWAGKRPIYNEYRVVATDKEKADALKDGWSLEPVLVDPDAEPVEPKPSKSKKGK